MNQDREHLCRRCLRCCYRMAVIDDVVYRTPFPCEYLDIPGRRCIIYDQRHAINSDCLSIETAIRHRALPNDCPYAADAVAGYNGAKILPPSLSDPDTLSWLGRELGVNDAMIDAVLQNLISRPADGPGAGNGASQRND